MMNFQRLNQLYQHKKVNLDILNARMADLKSGTDGKFVNITSRPDTGVQLTINGIKGVESASITRIHEEDGDQ